MKTKNTVRIGRALKALRKVEGLSQEEFAHWSGLSRNTIQRIEGGDIGQLSNLQTYMLTIGGMDVEGMLAELLEKNALGEPSQKGEES